MGCPPVRGDNPRALASGLSYVQVVKLFYTTYISVDLAHHELFCAKVGKGGINTVSHFINNDSWCKQAMPNPSLCRWLNILKHVC